MAEINIEKMAQDVAQRVIQELRDSGVFCEDCISRQAVLDAIHRVGMCKCSTDEIQVADECLRAVETLPPVNPQRTGHCKDCKYFEYNYKVDGMPFIVAHEICSKWGDGCMTKEDGYCFLFEPQESEEEK